jgi:ribonuclease P protein component
MTSSSRFPRARRVRRRAEFQQVFDAGRRVHGKYFTLLMAPNDASGVRLGIVASKKLGGAVQRNRAKRLIREIFRQSQPFPGRQDVDVVVIPRRELFDAAYSTLETDFRATYRRCAARFPGNDRRQP